MLTKIMDPSVYNGLFAIAGAAVVGGCTVAATLIERRWSTAKRDIRNLADQVASYYQLERLYKTALLAALLALAPMAGLAQQPIRPLPKVGGCPLGYYSSGGYCVPSSGGNISGAIEKVGGGCPLGFYASGNYCVSSPSNDNEAIEKTGKSCPLGWYSSSSYCVKSR